MKLSKDDLKQKINEKVLDEDVKIELLEDIEDSFENGETNEEANQRIEELEAKYKNLQEKYKSRFLQGSQETEDKENEDIKELEEKEVIDIKEI